MKDFSLQLFSVRDIPDLREQLKAAAEAGYTGVEFCGYFGIPAAEMKTILSSLGLRPAGSHIGWDLLAKDLDGCVAYAAELGLSSAACPCLDIQTAEDAAKAGVFLDKCALKFQEAGIPFAYHNHAHEFFPVEGKFLLEYMMENAPHLGIELDVYWAAFAGVDPIAFIQKHAGRFPLLHLKEIDAERKNVELGKGILDFPEIARLGLAQGTRELIVEQEAYTLPLLESIRVDADYMKSLQISE